MNLCEKVRFHTFKKSMATDNVPVSQFLQSNVSKCYQGKVLQMHENWIRIAITIALAVVLVASVPDAMAQKGSADAQRAATDPLLIKLVRSKVVLKNGREVFESAATAKPGDILEEVATYTNTSRSSLKGFEATLPVPGDTELVMASIKPANAMASVDGKTFAKLPLVQTVRQSNGAEVEQPVPLGQYRYLRWYPGEIAAGKSMTVTARFKVADTPVVAAKAEK